jgi:hypothetical protein
MNGHPRHNNNIPFAKTPGSFASSGSAAILNNKVLSVKDVESIL